MSVRHRAPRQLVVEISRTAGYGTTRYRHRLLCGHVEVRRRPSPAAMIGCATCADQQEREQAMAAAVASLPADNPVTLMSPEATIEVQAARLKAGLAALLNVDLEDVVMYTTSSTVTGASVWISELSLHAIQDRLLGS